MWEGFYLPPTLAMGSGGATACTAWDVFLTRHASALLVTHAMRCDPVGDQGQGGVVGAPPSRAPCFRRMAVCPDGRFARALARPYL